MLVPQMQEFLQLLFHVRCKELICFSNEIDIAKTQAEINVRFDPNIFKNLIYKQASNNNMMQHQELQNLQVFQQLQNLQVFQQ